MLSAVGEGIFGERTGSGPAEMLLLHGWGRTHRDWAPVLGDPALEDTSSLAIDLPGFGASPAPGEPWGAREYAAAIEGILDEATTPVVLVGHSRGGAIALCLAARRPEAVRGLVLTGAPLLRRAGSASKAPLSYRLIKTAARLKLVPPARLEEARATHGSADYRAATGVMRDILVRVVNESYEPELSAVHPEVRLVWGAEDHDVPVEVAQRAQGHLDRGSLEVVEGAGHLTPRDCPEVLARAIAAVLEAQR